MLKTLNTLFVFICSFLICFNGYSQNLDESLTNELKELNSNGAITGYAAAIFTSDTLLYSNGFGYLSIDDQQNYTPDTRQKVASITKLHIGVSLMKAQEMGLLKLDDPVNDYLPFELVNPNHPDKVITIRHLATHTAGLNKLPKYDLKALYTPTKAPKITNELPFGLVKMVFNQKIKSINSNEEMGLEDFLTNLYSKEGEWYSKKHFHKKAPGIETVYSNNGASLAALIVEKASGEQFSDFVRKHILDPLRMSHTRFDFETNVEAGTLAEPYHAGLHFPKDYRLLIYPAGGMESSVADYYLFMSSITKGLEGESPILSKKSIAEMVRPQLGDLSHGIFWETSENYLGHSGDIIGATTYSYYNREKGVGYLLFSNTAGSKKFYKEIREVKAVLKEYFDKYQEG